VAAGFPGALDFIGLAPSRQIMKYLLTRIIMARLNRNARRVTLCASLAIVALMATAVPLKPAAADNEWRNDGQWRDGGHGHGEQHGDRNWRHRGHGGGGSYSYRGPSYYYAPPPSYYYPPAPVYYQPPPVYYAPAPVYGTPGISLDVVIPLRIR
jgi:hypothetical protein